MKSEKIRIELGLRRYEVCDTEGNVLGVLRFNPSDPGFAGRWQALADAAEAFAAAPPETPAALLAADEKMKGLLDAAFAAPVAGVLFCGQSCFALCADGSFVLEHVVAALEPVISEALRQAAEASEKRVAARVAAYDGQGAQVAPVQTSAAAHSEGRGQSQAGPPNAATATSGPSRGRDRAGAANAASAG